MRLQTRQYYLNTIKRKPMKTAKEVLISEFEAGNLDDITTNPDPDFSLPFYQKIIQLMNIYLEQSTKNIK